MLFLGLFVEGGIRVCRAPAVIDGPVKNIWIIIVLKCPDQDVVPLVMQVLYELGNTAVQQFHTGALADVGLHHHGVRPPDPAADLQQLCCFRSKVRNTVIVRVKRDQG